MMEFLTWSLSAVVFIMPINSNGYLYGSIAPSLTKQSHIIARNNFLDFCNEVRADWDTLDQATRGGFNESRAIWGLLEIWISVRDIELGRLFKDDQDEIRARNYKAALKLNKT